MLLFDLVCRYDFHSYFEDLFGKLVMLRCQFIVIYLQGLFFFLGRREGAVSLFPAVVSNHGPRLDDGVLFFLLSAPFSLFHHLSVVDDNVLAFLWWPHNILTNTKKKGKLEINISISYLKGEALLLGSAPATIMSTIALRVFLLFVSFEFRVLLTLYNLHCLKVLTGCWLSPLVNEIIT